MCPATDGERGFPIGFKDAGGVNKPAQARIRITTNGGIYLQCGTVEIGQGVQTALSQIVAELLNAPLERISYPALNTDYTPFDQGTNASSAVVVMAQAVQQATLEAKAKVMAFAADQLDCAVDDLELDDWSIRKGNESHPLPLMIMRYYGGTGYEFTGEGFFKAAMDHAAPLETQCVSWEFGWGRGGGGGRYRNRSDPSETACRVRRRGARDQPAGIAGDRTKVPP